MILFFFIILNLLIILNFHKIYLFKLNLDIPDNKRKHHKKPTPLAGGTIILINQVFFWFLIIMFPNLFKDKILFENYMDLNLFIFISTIIFLLGFFDDKFNIKANYKFILLSFIILIFLTLNNDLIIKEIKFSFYDRVLKLDGFSIPFTIFSFLVFMNAFNMFDGINLQSTSYSLIILICISLFFLHSIFISVLIISLLCFFYLNNKNYSFLGDSGTLLLSFIISYIFIKLYNSNIISTTDEIVIYMLIPGIDLIRLFIIRILNKKNPLSPDKNHLHHLLILKYSHITSIVILICLLLIPIILNTLDVNNFFTILVSVFAYFIIFLKIR